MGFKLVPLSENHIPAIKEWGSIYDNPDYWNKDKFNDPSEYSRFTNVVSTVGITHIKNTVENKDFYIRVLDVDSQYVYDILSRPISQLINSSGVFAPVVQEFLKSVGILDESQYSGLTILDVCKTSTFVTKSKESYGYHIWWLSHTQNNSVLTRLQERLRIWDKGRQKLHYILLIIMEMKAKSLLEHLHLQTLCQG